MVLAADLFENVVNSLNPGRAAAVPSPTPSSPIVPSAATGGGLRRGTRVPVATRLIVIPFAPGAEGLGGYDFPLDAGGSPRIPLAGPVSVPVRDLSRGGVRFLMPRRLPLDTPFVLLLPPAPGTPARPSHDARPMAVECTVTYWQPIQRDLFAIGAQFVRVLPQFAAPSQSPTVVLSGFGDVTGGSAEVTALRPAV